MNLVSLLLALAFAGDRLLKLIWIRRFFRRPGPPSPTIWPDLTLIQPITRGATRLAYNLAARLRLDYPGSLSHILVCDAADGESQAICRAAQARFPHVDSRLVLVESPAGIADKVTKMQAGFAGCKSKLIGFIDDDIAPPPHALRQMVPYLLPPQVGSVFGLAWATCWNTPWASLMSLFVNSQSVLSYVPLSEVLPPYTITGHFYLLKQRHLRAIGGLAPLTGRLDDDHDLARRLRAAGLRLVQTPLRYEIANDLPDLAAYTGQLKRWFVFPRQMMLPYLTRRETLMSGILSPGLFLPGFSLLAAVRQPTRMTLGALVAVVGFAAGLYAVLERSFGLGRTPVRGWLLFPLMLLLTPLHIIAILLWPGNEVIWRGRRLNVRRGGRYEVRS